MATIRSNHEEQTAPNSDISESEETIARIRLYREEQGQPQTLTDPDGRKRSRRRRGRRGGGGSPDALGSALDGAAHGDAAIGDADLADELVPLLQSGLAGEGGALDGGGGHWDLLGGCSPSARGCISETGRGPCLRLLKTKMFNSGRCGEEDKIVDEEIATWAEPHWPWGNAVSETRR